MKVTLESTDRVVEINGVPARIWQGETAAGVRCHAYVTRIACAEDADAAEFTRDLLQTAPLQPELARAIPRRLVL